MHMHNFMGGCLLSGSEWLEKVTVVVSNQTLPPPIAIPLTEPDYTFCAKYIGIPPTSSTIIFACGGCEIFARYVYVYLPNLDQSLTLCEVDVFTGGKSYAR